MTRGILSGIGVGLALLLCGAGLQTTASLPRFDVVSIKAAAPGAGGVGSGGIIRPGGFFVARGATVRSLMNLAFNVSSPELITGLPGWAESERFAIEARPASGAAAPPRSQTLLMIEALLYDRFKLGMKTEVRTVPGYRLVIARGGIKVTASTDDGAADRILPPGGAQTVAQFLSQVRVGPDGYAAEFLIAGGQVAGSAPALPVADATGLTGRYGFASALGRDGFGPATGEAAQETLSQLFAQKLGLELVPAKVQQTFYKVTSVTRPEVEK